MDSSAKSVSRHRRIRWAAVACAALSQLCARPSPAAHGGLAWSTIEVGCGCYSCHTLDPTEGEPGTSFINTVARTIQLMKSANGGSVPHPLGCTFCHNNNANTRMKGVLDDFRSSHASRHPTGFNYVSRTASQSYYLSGVGSKIANEIDCVDCHDTALLDADGSVKHVGHADAAGAARLQNPSMLRNVSAPGQYDPLCRLCHSTAGVNPATVSGTPGKTGGAVITLSSHSSGTITQANGVPLKPGDTAGANRLCTACHDTHYSNNVRLFNDGHEGDAPILGSDCLAVCHYPGDKAGYVSDADNVYTRHGHGRATSTYKYRNGAVDYGPSGNYYSIALACTSCHAPLDTSDTSANRKRHNTIPTAGAANDRYVKRFNLSLPVQSFDTGSSFGNPLVGICTYCHGSYDNHTGTAASIGCQDCHSPHGEGSGSGSNVFMIPQASRQNGTYAAYQPARHKSGVESVAYGVERRDPATGNPRTGAIDQFRADGAGVCDNLECHGGTAGTIGPLATLLGAGGSHIAGTQSAGADCEGCHRHNGDPGGGWRATATCVSCHGPGGSGPTVVWPAGNAPAGKRTTYGSHLGATSAEENAGFLTGVSNWAGQCNKCHDFHGGAIKVPAPPASWADPSGRLAGANMKTRLGLSYANETNVALHLGGTSQGGASEAEFCWGCHDANGVSEWGYNTKTTPSGYPVVTFATADGNQESENHGWIYADAGHAAKTSDWTAGYWLSPYDPILARRIASVHSASFDPAGQSSSVAANVDAAGVVNRGSPTLEGRGFLRCSYCHDVHDTLGPDGKPYLRGRWVGNPYPPELPPRPGYLYTTGANVSYTTPRGLSTARDKGGYFIDQNSGWPTNNAAMDSLQETAELCTLCHGADVDGLKFYTGKTLWRAPMVNGHSNSTIGGTGANKVDLFTGMRYGYGMAMQAAVAGPPYVCGPYGGQCDSTYPFSWWMNGCCDGSPVIYNSGWFGGPAGTFTQGGGDYANWYGTGTVGGAQGAGSMAHKFTCSKCHSPHASGLPALLIQNCIDPQLGTWTTVSGYSGANLIANNCHRKTTAADGWHILAPGQ
jgi:hypothetical protein